MRNTLVTTLSASLLVAASLVAMPSSAQSQVVIIIGNRSTQPYYPPPYPIPRPYPYPQPYPNAPVVYGGGFYPGYGYRASDYGYYNGYYGGGYGYSNGYYDSGYYSPY